MAINIQQELERLYQANQTQQSSLTERLNQMDRYAGEVNPGVRKEMLDFSDRPAGYNPLQDVASAIDFSERSRDARSAAGEDLQRTTMAGLDLLGQLDALAQRGGGMSEEEKFLQALKLEAAKEDIKQGRLRFNPTTGQLEMVSGSGDVKAEIKKKVSGLKPADKNPINDLSGAVKELAKLRREMAEIVGDPNDVASLFQGTTGPIASKLSNYLDNDPKRKQLRTDIQTFQDQIRKDLFGSAFTATEKQVASLPSSDKQEATNIRIINSLLDSKSKQLQQRLVNAGLSEGEATAYLQSLVPQQQPKQQPKKGAGRFQIERVE